MRIYLISCLREYSLSVFISFNQVQVSIGKDLHDESLNYENAEHDLIFHGRNLAKPNYVTLPSFRCFITRTMFLRLQVLTLVLISIYENGYYFKTKYFQCATFSVHLIILYTRDLFELIFLKIKLMLVVHYIILKAKRGRAHKVTFQEVFTHPKQLYYFDNSFALNSLA